MKKYFLLLTLLASITLCRAQMPDTSKKPPLPANGIDPDKDNSDPIFISVETSPQFPGGMDSLHRYLSKNLAYPSDLVKAHTGGLVIVNFVVEKDGSLSQIQVFRSPDERITAALTNAFQGLTFTPAKQNGHIVRAIYNVPVRFDPAHPKRF
jgi:protein TonB